MPKKQSFGPQGRKEGVATPCWMTRQDECGFTPEVASGQSRPTLTVRGTHLFIWTLKPLPRHFVWPTARPERKSDRRSDRVCGGLEALVSSDARKT